MLKVASEAEQIFIIIRPKVCLSARDGFASGIGITALF